MSASRNSWMKIVFKDFCLFTSVNIPIYMGSYRRSYIILVWKFQTSQMLEKWSRTSKLSHIKLYHYPDSQYIFSTCTRTHLSAIPIKLAFWYLQIFSCVYNFECWMTCQLCWFRCKAATVYVLDNFSEVYEDWYFSWL